MEIPAGEIMREMFPDDREQYWHALQQLYDH